MSTKLAALSRIEEELLLIGECTANIRLSLEPTSSGSGGVAGDARGLPVITEDISAEEVLRDYSKEGGTTGVAEEGLRGAVVCG